MFNTDHVASLIADLREAAWQDGSKVADAVLRKFAADHPSALDDFRFLELREYLEENGIQ